MSETRTVATVFLSGDETDAQLNDMVKQCEHLLDHRVDLRDMRHQTESNQTARTLRVTVTLE